MQRKMKVSQPKRRNIFRFTVGQNRTGCWLVSDKLGLIGGLFIDKEAALRFAKMEGNASADEIQSLTGEQHLEVGDVFSREKTTH
ncbi:hypothetical protein FY152_08135 [Agrobacterium tumefaciens]|nr:hypothetical protein FY152_08135 [Agrobacterium tumefaciens]